MRNLKRLAVLALTLVVLGAVLLPMTASADTPYVTYTINGYGQIRQTQTAYLAYATITKFGEDVTLSAPSDICIASDGHMYIADTGNARIVVGTLDGELIKTIGEGILVNPRGVFVTDDGSIYVADRDANKIVVFNQQGKVIQEYGKPTSPLYGDANVFQPIKLVVNDAGIMFIVCESNTNGIVEISARSWAISALTSPPPTS